jgi:hypothetical protein
MTLQLGTTMANVERAEAQLGAQLPEPLRDAYIVANKALEVEIHGEIWTTYPVFDPDNAARTANHLTYENAPEQRWDGFPADAIAIGNSGSGDQLVLLVRNGCAMDVLHVWNHETADVRSTSQSTNAILDAARAEAARIAKLQGTSRR